MNLKEALIYAIGGREIRRASWPENNRVRLVQYESMDVGKVLRFELRSAVNVPVIKTLQDLDAGATDWEIYKSAPVETKSEDKPFRDMSDNELLTWTGGLTRRLAHEFAVRRPSPRFDAMKYTLRTVSYFCNL